MTEIIPIVCVLFVCLVNTILIMGIAKNGAATSQAVEDIRKGLNIRKSS